MKKLIALAAAALLIMPATAKDKKEKKADNDSLIFTTIIEQPRAPAGHTLRWHSWRVRPSRRTLP